MSRWFRHYAGMMRDDKLVRVAIRSKQTVERVVWIWGAILESAAEIDDNGRFDLDEAEVAYFLRADEADVHAILVGLADAGRIAADRVVKWSDRQFQSDRSAPRQAAYRERKRAQRTDSDGDKGERDGVVTSLARHRDAPETELEAEDNPPAPLARGREKGFKIPPDWKPPLIAELSEKAREYAERWPAGRYEAEAEAFVAFWLSDGRCRKDWRLAWINRVIQIHSQVMRDARFAPPPNVVLQRPMTAADLRRGIQRAEDFDDPERAAELRKQLSDMLREQRPRDPKVAQLVTAAAKSMSVRH